MVDGYSAIRMDDVSAYHHAPLIWQPVAMFADRVSNDLSGVSTDKQRRIEQMPLCKRIARDRRRRRYLFVKLCCYIEVVRREAEATDGEERQGLEDFADRYLSATPAERRAMRDEMDAAELAGNE
jgi:hypothetical protein